MKSHEYYEYYFSSFEMCIVHTNDLVDRYFIKNMKTVKFEKKKIRPITSADLKSFILICMGTHRYATLVIIFYLKRGGGGNWKN